MEKPLPVRIKEYLKKLGWATVLFFVIKGTITTLIMVWAGTSLTGC